MSHFHFVLMTVHTGQGRTDESGRVAVEEGEIRLHTSRCVNSRVHHGLTSREVSGPLAGVTIAEGGEDGLQ